MLDPLSLGRAVHETDILRQSERSGRSSPIVRCASEGLRRAAPLTLDREWGGWRAALGSAAFFAVYHPLLAWLPVGMLGLINAVLFKKTGRLAPAVAVHMVYNFIVMI